MSDTWHRNRRRGKGVPGEGEGWFQEIGDGCKETRVGGREVSCKRGRDGSMMGRFQVCIFLGGILRNFIRFGSNRITNMLHKNFDCRKILKGGGG